MKLNKAVSNAKRKVRYRHFNAPSHIRRRIMSAALSKDLRTKYNIRSVPIRKGDEVQIVRGEHKESSSAKVTKVLRKFYVIQIERLMVKKCNQSSVPIGIHPSNVVITKLKIDKDRKDLLDRRSAGKLRGKDKYKEAEVS